MKIKIKYDMGDMDGYQKLSRVYDSLRKSAKFTAAQNKEVSNNYLTSVGELVDYCEKEGGKIPKYDINVPYDTIDKTINDLKQYNKSLIYSDVTLATQIENYIKQKTVLEKTKMERLTTRDQPTVTDEDFQEYYDGVENDMKLDDEINNGKRIERNKWA